jgi:hypothetical protein
MKESQKQEALVYRKARGAWIPETRRRGVRTSAQVRRFTGSQREEVVAPIATMPTIAWLG